MSAGWTTSLSVINQMGYTDYYLIVWDFIRFATQPGDHGRTGPRFRRRLAGGLLPGHHQHRPAAVCA